MAQSGSAPGWGPGGRRFKSCLPDYIGHNRAVLPMPNGWVDVKRLADAAIWLVSDEASWVTGAMIPVDGGWSSS